MNAEQVKKITGFFIEEAKEYLEVIESSINDLQSTVNDPERIQEAYRGAHSIKGGAAMLGIESIRFTAHRLEDYFKFLKNDPLDVDQKLTNLLDRVYRGLDSMIGKLEETLSLPSEFAENIMNDIQPIFGTVETHLNQLAAGEVEPEEETAAPHQTTATGTDSGKIAPEEIQAEVLPILTAIAQLQQEGDDPTHRAQIQSHFHQLSKLGQKWNCPGWSNLLKMAQGVIIYPHNPYEKTLQIILKNLDTATQKLIQGDLGAIAPSYQLKELQPKAPDPNHLDPNDEKEGTLADMFADAASDLEEDGFTEDNPFDFSDGEESSESLELDLDTENELAFDDLFREQYQAVEEDSSDDFQATMSNELEDLFGEENAQEDLSLIDHSHSTSNSHQETDQHADLLNVQGSKDVTLEPGQEYDSLHLLFGEDFSFEELEENTHTDSSDHHTNTPVSHQSHTHLKDDLNKDLDSLFSNINDPETQTLLDDESIGDFDFSTFIDEDLETDGKSSEDLPESGEFSDLLAISETPSEDSTTNVLDEELDFNANLIQDHLESHPLEQLPEKGDLDQEFDNLFDTQSNLNETNDLEAFLSGEDPEIELNLEASEFSEEEEEEEVDNLDAFLSGEPATRTLIQEGDEFDELFKEASSEVVDNEDIDDLDALLSGAPESSVVQEESDDFGDLFAEEQTEEEQGEGDDLDALLSGAPESSVVQEESDDFGDLFAEEQTEEEQEEGDDLDALLSSESESTVIQEESDDFGDLFAEEQTEEEQEEGDDLDALLSSASESTVIQEGDEFDALFQEASSELKEDEDIDDLEALLSGAPESTLAQEEQDELESLLAEESSEEENEEVDDLEALLSGEDSAQTPVPAHHGMPPSQVPAVQEINELLDDEEDLDDLAAFFGGEQQENRLDFEQEEEPIVEAEPIIEEAEAEEEPVVEAETAAETETVTYYARIEELEALIEQPVYSYLPQMQSWSELENLVEDTSQLTPEPAPEVPEATTEELPVPEPAESSGQDNFDDLEEMLKQVQVQAGEIPSEPAKRTPKTPRRSSRPKVEATLKVPVKQMDNLSNLVGELVVNRNSLEGDEERLRQFLDNLMHQVQSLSDVGGRMQDLYERSLLENALLRSRKEYRSQRTGEYVPDSAKTDADQHDFDELEMDSFTKFHELAQETIELIVRVRESTSDIQFLVDDIDQVARTLRQVTSQLQEGLTKARMIPFGNTGNRLPLAVRRIAPQLNKQANLSLEGQETLIDKMILEHLSDPLTHLVNNALTHGVEVPEVRLAAGKPQAGRIKVSALQQGNQTVIAVSDDGAGIDPDRVKAKAIEKGVITKAQAKQLSNLEVYDLLFHPGFSTKEVVDGFAGRGVGLDVVRTSINEIRGNVTIDSKIGKGTTFTIRLPLTLQICKALCCISENAPIAFPLDGVEDMFDMPHNKLKRNSHGQLCVPWHDALLPYTHLSELLSYNRRIGRSKLYGGKREENILPIVVLRGAGGRIAVGVDQALGEQEIVIKQLQGPIPKPPGVAGATVQGDGKIMAIADVLELIEISQGRIRKDMASPLWQAPTSLSKAEELASSNETIVLIVDDSITVRELLSMSFSKAGYRVEQARDGQDAWDKLRSGMPCDIVFCDIEMPRVDGLEFLSRLQKEEDLADIPVAMLTSRGADRHRKLAAELGASGYFTKPYLEDVLLDAAERMMEGEVLLPDSTRKHRPPSKKKARKAPEPTTPVVEETPSEPVEHPPTLVQSEETMVHQPSVLIVDDSVTVRSLLSMTFENAGYEVEQAKDGKDAFEKLQNGLQPDIALFDIEMPRMNGLELLETIQKDEELKKIPVAMLTSRGAQRYQKLAAEKGASAYFTKPYVEQELLAVMERVRIGEVVLPNSVRPPGITTRSGEKPPEPAPPELSAEPEMTFDTTGFPTAYEAQPETPSVLIVDDSVTVRSLLSMTFENAGYEVEQSRDGKDAFEKLQNGLQPDIALFDIEMPRMDGLELLGNLQQNEELKKIPVAMLTSRGADRHRKLAAERGASAYFTKPYVEQDLLAAVERIRTGEVLLPNSVRPSGITTRSTNIPTEEPTPEHKFEPDSFSEMPDFPTQSTVFQREQPLVLIVDDSVTVRSLLSMTFENAGYEVEQARDGKDALGKLQDGLNPDLAFFDIEMPKMDGLQLLENLQKDEELRQIPVAMLTSRGAKKHRQMAADRGAKGYFTKPYVEEVLLEAAQRLMNGEVLLEVEA